MKKLTYLLAFFVTIACHSSKNIENKSFVSPSGRVIIYKTKGDYYHHVPVTLSADKSKIVAYPHPSDLTIDEQFVKPIKLNGDYLLDNKGINQNSAFLKFTYEKYSKLKEAPSISALESAIIDNDPFTEMYDYGLKNSHDALVKQVNELIDNDELSIKCKKLK